MDAGDVKALVVALALAACGGPQTPLASAGPPACTGGSCASGGVAGSCTFTTLWYCLSYTGASFTEGYARGACTQPGTVYSLSACPAAGAIGTCVVYPGEPGEYTLVFLDGFSLPHAQDSCAQLRGVWTAL